MKAPREWSNELYRMRRQELLVELRVMRLTKPARRVVKHMQLQMRKLRTLRRMMEEA